VFAGLLRPRARPEGADNPRLVETVVARVGVSRGAFDEVFECPEDCILAAFNEGVGRISRAVLEATEGRLQWLERTRFGVVAFLGFLEDEPHWARLLILRAPLDGVAALNCTQRLHGVLAELLNKPGDEPIAAVESARSRELLEELVVGGVIAFIRARMLEEQGGPLVELAPSLMEFIAATFVGKSQGATGLELTATPAPETDASRRAVHHPILVTRRTTLVLRAIASSPRSSNSEIAQAAGIDDDGQISRLLKRLGQRGLIEPVLPRGGSRRVKAWKLTPCGRRLLPSLVDGGRAALVLSADAKVRHAA
jgi:DNA-binding MarR family transcriptional regulator